MSDGGRWVEITRPDGTTRRDWRPDEQPPSPDGGPGDWHVVLGVGGAPDDWAWIPMAAPAAPPRSPEWMSPPAGDAGTTAVLTAAPPAPSAKVKKERTGSEPREGARSRKTMAIVGGAAAAVIVAALVGAQAMGGGSGGGGIDPAAVAAQEQAAAAQLTQEIVPGFGTFQIVGDPVAGRRGYLEVTFTNSGQSTKYFDVVVEAVGADGVAIATSSAQVAGVDPGQSNMQTMFTNVPADQLDAVAGASFRIAKFTDLPPFGA